MNDSNPEQVPVPVSEPARATPTPATDGRSRFGRWVFRGLAAVGAMTLLFFTFLLAIPLLLLGGEPVPGRVIVELDLVGGVVESVPQDPVNALLGLNAQTVRDIVDALDRAKEDDRVVGLIARLGGGGLSLPHVEELRDAIADFRESGKPTVAFAETFGEFGGGQGEYLLASAFEEVHLQPSGDVGLSGLLVETPFAAQLLERVGVEPQMGYRYEYKDAVNVFTEEAMTAPQREATARVLTSMYENLVAGIAASRALPADEVRRLIDTGPHMAAEALDARLVDRLSYRDETYDSLRASLDGDFLYADEYLRRAGRPNSRGPQVALIYGTGAIQTGTSQVNPLAGGTVMGSETIARAFRDATESDEVRAIVFRVDSPGGSYVASDAIWRETMRAREAGKPVVVSMGSVAGSGGYFVAMGADRIVAQPSTITGSIGVYAGKMLIDELSANLGITWDTVSVGGNATMWSLVEGYSPSERARLEANLDRIYDDFTAKAASGRGLSRDSVHQVARGRIWTGVDALRIGLVDELGGLETAIRLAKEEAGIDVDQEVTLRVLPRERSFFEMLLEPEGESSYPAALVALAQLGRVVEELGKYLHAAGLLSPGSLTMPALPFR